MLFRSGDHQVQHEKMVICELDGDAFADSADRTHRLAFNCGDRWRNRAQQKRAAQADFFEPLAQHARFERFDVGADVRKLGHASRLHGPLQLLQLEKGRSVRLRAAATGSSAGGYNDRLIDEFQSAKYAGTRNRRCEMARYGKAAGKSVKSAVHREKRGKLKSGKGGKGGTVKSRKQAIAIGLSEARKKGAKVPRKKAA